MNKNLIAAVALCTCSSLSFASVIFGGYDCGQWVNRGRGGATEAWVIGYLSGLNVSHDQAGLLPRDPLDELNSAAQAYIWLDNFCRANPLRKLDGAAKELFEELKSRRKK